MRPLCFFCLLLPTVNLFGQKEPDCRDMLDKAKAYERQNELSKAVQYYLNALNCNLTLGNDIGPRLQGVFGKIERQKREVEAQRDKADSLYRRAERSAEANRLAALELQKSQTDFTVGWHLAYLAYQASFDSVQGGSTEPGVSSIMNEIFSDNDEWLYKIIEGHTDHIETAVYSPDGQFILTASRDHTARLWDKNGNLIKTLKGHLNVVKSAVFSPDGRYILTVGLEGTARVWENFPLYVDRNWVLSPAYLLSAGVEEDIEKVLTSSSRWELIKLGEYFYEKNELEISRRCYEKAEELEHNIETILTLYQITELSGHFFDFNRLLRSKNIEELWSYGEYFLKNEKWHEAKQLYEKAESKEHSANILQNLFEISEMTGESFDFNRFLKSEDVEELRSYGYYFFQKEKWIKAKQLYEKAEGKDHSTWVLLTLFEISEKTDEPFDYNRFLKSEDVAELSQYATFLTKKYWDSKKIVTNLLDYQNALKIRERQLLFDTTTYTRSVIANEYNNLAYFQLFLPDVNAVETNIRRAITLDPDNKSTHLILLPTLLLQNRFEEAKVEYLKWALKQFDDEYHGNYYVTYRDAFLSDFKIFRAQGLTIPRLDEIETLLKSLDIQPNNKN